MIRQARAPLVALAAFAAAVLSGEALLRVAFPGGFHAPLENEAFPWLEFDPALAWRNRPGFRHQAFSIDADGLTLAQGLPVPVARAVRVLCLGDSRTFGIWGVERGFRFDAYPAALQRLADAPSSGASLAVWNAGTIGYSVAKGLRQWVVRLGDLEPDVVLAAFGLNDHALAWNPAYALREPDSGPARHALHALARTRSGEALLFAWRRVVLGGGDLHAFQQLPAERQAELQAEALGLEREPQPWHTPEEYARHLALLAAEARTRRAKLLFVQIPLRPLELGENRAREGQPAPSYVLMGARDLPGLHSVNARYRAELVATAEREGVPVLDGEEVFRAWQRDHPGEALYSDYDLVHPNDRGAEVLAAGVLARLRELGWASSVDDTRVVDAAGVAGR